MSDEKKEPETIFNFEMGWSEPQGSGTVTSDPKAQEEMRRLIAWQRESAKMHWVLGKPVTRYKNP